MTNIAAAAYDRFETGVAAYGPLALHTVARLWIATIFLASGVIRVDRWGSQNAAFGMENGSPVPLIPDGRITQWLGIDATALIIPPEIIKYVVTGGELLFPVLLILGLFTRVSGLVMIFMAAVIQFWVGSIKESFYNELHYFWMLAGAVPLVMKPTVLTLDYWLTRKQALAMSAVVTAIIALWVIYVSL